MRSLYQVCADIAALAALMCVRGMRNHGLAQIETCIGQRDFKFFQTLHARRQGKPGRLQYRVPDSYLPSTRSMRDRKSTRLNSSHLGISYAVFCFKKKT